jgi:metallo-beta-lactamase family protein
MGIEKLTATAYGAAEEVAGSNLVIKTEDSKKIVIDTGSDMTSGEERRSLPFDSKTINFILYTHGHQDHIGLGPKFFKGDFLGRKKTTEKNEKGKDIWQSEFTGGFEGPILATPPTVDIARLQWKQSIDSTFWYNKFLKAQKAARIPSAMNRLPKKIIYDSKDLTSFMSQFQTFNEKSGIPYGETINLTDKIKATFYEAGHIPGSAQIYLEITKPNGKKESILTAFDLGRLDYKILGHPVADLPLVKFPHTEFSKTPDYLFIESTYGNKTHRPLEDSIKTLEEAVKWVSSEKRDGVLVIPAFSIMRTQLLLSFLYQLNEEGRIPKNVPIYLSSPMAVDVNKIILRHTNELDAKAKKQFENKGHNPFHFDQLVYHKTAAETINQIRAGKGPMVIISASGMCEQGRVVEFLKETIEKPNNAVLMTGYTARGTRGELLQSNETKIPFDTGYVEKKARIMRMGGLSAHADSDEIIAHIKNIDPEHKLKGIYVVHGEKESCHDLRKLIIEKLNYSPERVIVPKKAQEYELN